MVSPQPRPIGPPDPAPRSLGEAAVAAFGRWRRPAGDVEADQVPPGQPIWIATALFLLIASIPATVWIGARAIERSSAERAAAIEHGLAPERARAAAAASEHEAWARAIGRLRVAVLIDRLAGRMPADARIVSMSSDAAGMVSAEISVVDPAELRSALRADPTLSVLKTGGERRGDGGTIVTLTGTPR